MATINITGTGGIIEGNLGAANVNVNLEPAPRFDETASATTNSYITGADINDMEVATYSIMCWFKPIPSNGTQQDNTNGLLMIKDNTVQMGLHNSTGTVRCYSRPDGSWSSVTTSTTDCRNSWHHACFTWDGSNNRLYIDGNLEATVAASGAAAAGNSNKFIFGAKAQDDDQYEGYIKDVKLYSAVLDATAIGIAAQKINTDLELIGNVSDCEAWYKFDDSTDSTPEDSTTNNNDCTGTGADVTWVHDAFSVDVYDNSTTTDGTFTVTQGKVEGLALTAAHFTGATDNYVGSALTSDQKSTREQTFSCWFNADDVTGRGIAGRWTGASQASETALFLDSSSNLVMKMNSTDSDGSGTYSNQSVTGSTTILADKWYHVVCVASSVGDDNFLKIYVNGVLDGTNSSYGKYIQSASSQFRWGWAWGGTDQEFDGHIRDVRIYAGKALTADQVSSLYSGSYNVTPDCWFKADAGSGTDAAAFGQSGLYTATSVSPNNVDSTWLNGTLDLDGTLTIAANGTLSAPRGTLQLSDDFTIAADTSTFTHNNGTVEILGNVELLPADFDSSENERHIFYNILHTSHTLYIERPTTIENQYTKTGGTARQYTKTTFGTATSAGTMTINAGNWSFYGYYGSPTLQGANELYPLIVTGSGYSSNGPIDWDTIDNEARSPDTFNYIKWIDFQKDMVTGGNGGDAVMLGDCEFDAFTISSGDSLDLNGQRVEFGGDLTSTGNINGGGLIFARGDYSDGNGSGNSYTSKTLVMDGGYCNPAQTTWQNMFLRSGTHTIGGVRSWSDTPLFVGGTTNFTSNNTWGNITLATGSTMTANDDTITCRGDFTTSGGLIGKSGLLFDGTNDYMRAGTYGVANNFTGWSNNNITVEVWAKSSDSSQAGIMASRWGASGSRQFILYQEANGSVRAAINSDGGSTYVSTNGAEAGVSNSWTNGRDGKWHHYALTYDGANLKLYIDGQLYANRATAVTLVNGVNSIFGIGAYNVNSSNTFSANGGFIGDIHRCSVWNHTLTESEIRGMMFYDYATMDADSDFNTPKGDLKGWYQFDEGADSTIDNMQGTDNVDGLRTGATWAGAGTFTIAGDNTGSTLVMAKSGTQTMNIIGGEFIDNLTVNDGSTTQIYTINDAGSTLNIAGNLIVNEKIKSHASSASNKLTLWNTQTIVVGSDVKTTALADMHQIKTSHTGGETITIPECTIKTLDINASGGTVVASGDLTFTTELQVGSGTTFNANGNTITTREADINGSGGTLDLRNSTLSLAYSSAALRFEDNCVLLSGNSTITGLSSASKAFLRCPAAMGAELVGTLKFMNAEGGGTSTSTDITVIGPVIDCSFADSTANIRQWHHTLDTQQLLDADEAGDDDLRLTKPALDNALELMTK